MTTRATFALLREGTSDDGLIPHLGELLIRAGLDEVSGASRDYKGTVIDCLRRVMEEESPIDLVFVHRDTDGPSDNQAREEMSAACDALGDDLGAVVPVVPIQELEAWLLLDEQAIRAVVGRPSKKVVLELPKVARVEATSSPKEMLQVALLTASGTTGRRLKDEKRRFSDRRRTLLERLDIDGPVRALSAWQALERDIESAVTDLLTK